MGGKGGGSGKMEVADYYLSVHLGICLGPIDALTGIYIGEKAAWEGEATAEQTIVINKPDLFGGVKKEGGAVGEVRFMPGKPPGTATMLSTLAARLGLTSDTCPAYTGLASLFFVGSTGTSSGGFKWGSNSPYLKSVWARVRRRSNTFPAKAGEPSNYSDMGSNCNPAHMIYECLTNTEWGMGASTGIIDVGSFQDCAKTFYNEGFGLTMVWTRQTTIEAFIGEILDHVQAMLFLNQRTGLLTLKAIRADYNPNLLSELTPDNCTITKFQRKVWGETINEINVTWTNPVNEQEETVTQHDLANIETQGAVVSDTRNYYGVRSPELAMKIAVRDIRSSAAPLASFEIECDRTVFGIVPGSVRRLNYPEYGIEDVVVRVNNIDYGRPGDSTIKLSAIEDIFALPQSAYSVQDGTQWSDGAAEPSALERTKIITLPLYFATQVASQYALAAAEYPEVFAGALGSTSVRDTRGFELLGETTTATGGLEYQSLGSKNLVATSILQTSLAASDQSTLTYSELGLGAITAGAAPQVNGFAFIGDGAETDTEICLISAIGVDFSSITFERGSLDTVPRAWPAGTVVRFVASGQTWAEETIYAAGQTANFKANPSTSLGSLGVDDAPVVSATFTGRPHLPQRPANVQVGTERFGSYFQHATSNISISWSNRNRLTEDSQVPLWNAGDISPEAGQTTTVRVLDMDRNVITTHNGLTGTSFSLPYASFGGRSAAIVKVSSARDGLESLQGHEIFVGFGRGYGMDYGNNYGDI